MSIQFVCEGCGNQLGVPDDAAGKKARCPKCGTVVNVPVQASAPAGDLYSSDGSETGGDERQLHPPEDSLAQGPASPVSSPSTGAHVPSAHAPKPLPSSDNPYASPAMGYDEPTIRKTDAGEFRPTIIDFGDVLSHAWDLYMQNVGMVLGAVMLAYAIKLVLNYAVSFMSNIVMLVIGENDAAIFVAIPLAIVVYLVQIAIATFLNIGVWRVLLDVGKGQHQDFSKLFSGADIFLPMYGATLLWFLMVSVGTTLLIVPGIAILLLFGQFHFLMIDQRLSVMESFSASIKVARSNWPTLLGIYAVSLLIAIGSGVACLLPLIFFGPYISMAWTVMYLKMTGQPVARA